MFHHSPPLFLTLSPPLIHSSAAHTSPSSFHLPRPSSLRSLWDDKRFYSRPRSQPYATPAADSRHRGQPVQWGLKHRSVSRTIQLTPSTSPPLYDLLAILVSYCGRRAPGPGPRFKPSTSTQRSAAENRHSSDMHVAHRRHDNP
ncbi:hypothetical protein GY45DRAFT_1324089 [Cubamyces sp. BRFM 1775]|nr:hypothetical protein GY45DRAFT_1324089 [Cubamyces sp. BRFM 1775]